MKKLLALTFVVVLLSPILIGVTTEKTVLAYDVGPKPDGIIAVK
ncbi:hypothetical protein [Tumebacillus permanentifrigoris]|nr:hypothetical protein [Tumebacillus permanentifrigoris]